MSEEIGEWVRTLSTDPKNRLGVIKLLSEHCATLPMDKAYTVTVEAQEETRKKAQNDLMWAWNAEAARAQGTTPDWQHGEWKLTILLPLQKSWKRTARRAQRIQDTMDALGSYKLQVFAAYDMVRTKTLGVRRMSEALSAYKRTYEQQGIALRSRQDLINDALMQGVDEEAA